MNKTTVANLQETITVHLRTKLSDLLAVYAFGSRIQGTYNPQSDLDLAVLVGGKKRGYVDTVKLWDISGEIADIANCDIDLLDMRAASTVMQYQILTTGQRWWAKGNQAALFEIYVMKEKIYLDEARSGAINDIIKRGKVYG